MTVLGDIDFPFWGCTFFIRCIMHNYPFLFLVKNVAFLQIKYFICNIIIYNDTKIGTESATSAQFSSTNILISKCCKFSGIWLQGR